MSEQDIGYLMDDSRRDLAFARRFRDEGIFPRSINDSYYAAFYAAKAYLLHLDITSKSHKVDVVVAVTPGDRLASASRTSRSGTVPSMLIPQGSNPYPFECP